MKSRCTVAAWLLVLTLSIVYDAAVAADAAVEVRISGVDDELLDNVRAFLSIARLQPDKGLVPLPGSKAPQHTEAQVRRLHRLAPAEIREALQPFGYYQPDVDSSLTRDNKRWIAEYNISTGPAVIVRNVEIRVQGPGQGDAAINAALQAVELEPGQRLQHGRYDKARKALLDSALASGYLDARYTRSELRVSVIHKSADAILVLKTGEQYYFGAITINQDILRPAFVARFIDLEPGTPFDARKLLDLQLALTDSGYFRSVEVRIARQEASDNRIPVYVDTEPHKPRRYGIGVGYGTDTGPRLSLAAEFRRINRRGHSILADARVSQVSNTLGLHYNIPIRNVATDRLVFSGNRTAEDVGEDGTSDRTVLGVSENIEWRNFHRRLYLNFQRETFEFGDDKEKVTYLIPGASLSKLKSDNVMAPRRGYSWSVDVRGSAEQLRSETSFVRTEASLRTVFALGERNRLLMRAQGGTTAVEEFSKLPTTERFFAGGDQSVRGYAYEKLAPTNDDGDIIGGRHLVTGSIELERLFRGNLGAAVFVDTGNAFNETEPDLKTGAGIGLRWRTPVGMLRVDFAHPFNDSDDNLRLHISIGPDL